MVRGGPIQFGSVAATDVGERDVVGRLARIGYTKARLILLAVGLAILAIVVVGLMARSVDEVEVFGTLLYVPIFVLLMYFGVTGGLLGAVAATVGYVVLRGDAIDAVGWSEFSGTVISHGLGYVLFGVAGGWAASTLELSLDKLDLYDQVDDDTGLYNSRYLLHEVAIERARSVRYENIFSVSFAAFSADSLSDLPQRRRRRVLRDLGRLLDGNVRAVDSVAHGYDGRLHHVAVLLPETPEQGVDVFHERFVASLHEFLASHDVSAEIDGMSCTIPGAEDELDRRLEVWRGIDAAEHEHDPVGVHA